MKRPSEVIFHTRWATRKRESHSEVKDCRVKYVITKEVNGHALWECQDNGASDTEYKFLGFEVGLTSTEIITKAVLEMESL